MDIMNMEVIIDDGNSDLLISEKEPKKTKPKKFRSVSTKLIVLKEYDKVKSVRKISQKYDLPVNTLRRWINDRSKLDETKIPANIPRNAHLFKERKDTYGELEEALYLWYDLATRGGIHLTAPKIREKALELVEPLQISFNATRFNAADHWISHWKKKYGIKTTKTPPNPLHTENELKKVEAVIEENNYELCQIFRVDEIVFDYKNIFDNLKFGNSSKRYQNYVSVMICTNADGTLKLPMVISGPIEDKEKVLSKCTRPVNYVYQRSAWITCEILKTWFKNTFCKEVASFLRKKGLPPKALLLLDSTPCHPNAESLTEGDIKVHDAPRSLNKTPDELYITDFLKISYIKLLAQSLVLAQKTDNISLETFLKKFKIDCALNLLTKAWEEVADMSIFKCWKYILPNHFRDTKVDFKNDRITIKRDLYNIISQIKEFQDLDEEIVDNWVEENEKDIYSLPTISELLDMISGKDLEEGDQQEDNQLIDTQAQISNNLEIVEESIDIDEDDVKPDISEVNIAKKGGNNENETEEDGVTAYDVVIAAEKIIAFYEQKTMLSEKELSVIKKARDIALEIMTKNDK